MSVSRDNVLHFESASSWEDGVTFALPTQDRFALSISVAEEKAVDSYNQTFVCRCHLTEKQVEKLRHWLNEAFPK